MAQSFTYNDINNAYKTNLGRDASQDEYANWANGSYGSDPFNQIANSGEANAYKASKPTNSTPQVQGPSQPVTNSWQNAPDSHVNTGTPVNPNAPPAANQNPFSAGGTVDWQGRTSDDQKILGRIAAWSQQAGSNPSLKNDPNYWLGRIKQEGGLGSDNDAYWANLGMRPEGAPEGGGGGQSGPGGGGNFGGGNVGGGSYGMNSPQSNQIFDLLMKRANGSLNIDPNDPIIRNQVDAYNAQNTRASRDYLANEAERQGPNANLTGETRMASEKVGQAGGQFQAQLMQRELDARRQEIQSALSGASGFLTQEQQLQLQQEMDALNRQQRGYEFDVNDQFRNSPLGS